MKNKDTDNIITRWLPTHWVTAIVNNDYSGMSDEEEKQIKDYLEDLDGWVYCPDEEALENEQCRPFPYYMGPWTDCIEVNIILNNQ